VPDRGTPRDGTYLLRDHLDTEPLQAMIERKRLFPDVLDARDTVETKLAELAAGRRQETDLLALDDAIAVMRTPVASGIWARLRTSGSTARSSRPRAALCWRSSWPASPPRWPRAAAAAESRRESLRQLGRPPQSLRQHEEIAAAIRAGDPAAAAACTAPKLVAWCLTRVLRFRLGGLVVLADHAAGYLPLLDWEVQRGGGLRFLVGR
jgi:GntR family transcriptional repressor for pyruvate dehydrogenase complex